VAALLYGLVGDAGSGSATATMLGLGSVLMIFGFALLAPALVRPLSSLIGRPLERLQGLTGRLARENARRQPQRTAVTASALMIGVALVVLVTIFAAGLSATIDKGIDDQVRAASIVTHEDGFSPLSEGVPERLQQVDGVTSVSAFRFETGRLAGETGNTTVMGVDTGTVRDVLTLEWAEGSDAVLTGLGTEGAAVNDEFADERDLAVGDSLTFTTPRGDEVTYRVSGIYDAAAGVVGGVLVSNESLVGAWESDDIAFAMVAGAEDQEALKRAEEAALADFPTARAMTVEDFKDEQNQQV
jgi:putative ABC transport system permease protein